MNRERAFQIVLRLVGLIFVAGIYPLTVVWPSGWSWHTGHSDYLQMILGVYAALGVFLLIASRRPADHRSLIAFAAWSSLVHAGIMAMQALMNTGEQAHLLGDAPLACGETLTLFYTMGSPVALWSLRYENFGKPIHVPSPKLHNHYANLAGEWVNFYGKADVIGYPLKELNADYRVAVTSDCPVLVGGPLAFWNPLSHMAYFGDTDVLGPIAEGLVGVWQTINAAQ